MSGSPVYILKTAQGTNNKTTETYQTIVTVKYIGMNVSDSVFTLKYLSAAAPKF